MKRAAPAPAPPAQALRIQLRILRQHRVQHSELILELHGAKIVPSRLGKIAPSPVHAAIVGMQHGKAMLCQQLVEEQGVAPAVGHRLLTGPAVGIHDQRHRGWTWGAWACRPSGNSSVA